jgi:serine protease Do
MGVSFAIPIETALKVSAQLRRHGAVTRGFLGIEAQPVSDILAASFDLEAPRGALVTAVHGESPASRAGIRPGDIVLAYGGKTIERPSDLVREVSDSAPGTRADVELWRRRAILHAAVIVAPAPDSASTRLPAPAPGRRTLGLVLTEVAPYARSELQIPCGLVVDRVESGGHPPMLQSGDVIVAVNDTQFATRAEFDRLVEARVGLPVALLVLRAGRAQYVALDTELL